MLKVLVTDLKKEITVRAALQAIPDLFELLSLNDKLSGDQVFGELVLQALREFEYYEPLIMHIQTYLNVQNGVYSFTDNFNEVIQEQVDEKYLEMVPDQVIGITQGQPWQSAYIKTFTYEKPKLYNRVGFLSSGLYTIKGIFNRPAIIKYDSGEVLNPESAIYFIQSDRSPLYSMFQNQVTLTVVDHILGLKNNYSIGDNPVDICSVR